MRKRKRLLVIATITALAVSSAVGTAALHAGAATTVTTYPTDVNWVTGAGNGSDAIIAGRLKTNSKCLRLRRVLVYQETTSGWTRVDKILSSARGAWGFRYESNFPNDDRLKFTATEETRRNGRIVCEAGTQVFPPASSNAPGPGPSSVDVPRGGTTHPTIIHWRAAGIDETSTFSIITGQLDTNSTCLGLRKVVMYVQTSSGWRRVDTVLSSSRGAWAFRLEGGLEGVHVRWTVSQDTRRSGTETCEGSSAEETF